MKKICFVGGPSTGKTTLIEKLVKKLRKKKFKAKVIGDPARIYIEKWIHNKREMMTADQYWILKDWLEKEKEAEGANFDFVLCDGASFLSYIYTFLFEPKEPIAGPSEAWMRHKSFKDEIFKIVMENLPNYDYIFFIPQKFPPKEDGVRLFTDKAYLISLRIRAFLDTYLWQDLRWRVISGKPEKRVKKVLEIILKTG